MSILQRLRSRLTEIDTERERLVSRAETARRDMTPAEYTRFNTLGDERRELHDRIVEVRQQDARRADGDANRAAIGGFGQAGDPSTRTGDTPRILRRSDSYAEWAQRRGMLNTGPENRRDGLSFDRFIRGMVTGVWDGAEAEQRAVASTPASAGGVLIPAPLMASFIDRARAAARVLQAGAGVVPMTSATLTVPRLVGEPTPAWRTEGQPIGDQALSFDSVKLTARSAAMLVRCSFELFEDSEPGIDDVIEHSFAQQVGAEWDRVALRGSGDAPEPRGVRNTTGVTVTALGGADGLALSTGTPPPAYDPLVDLLQVVRNGNFEPTAFIDSPRTETSLARSRDAQGQYLAPPAALADIPRLPTNQVQTDRTAGGNDDASEIYCGDWTQLLLGVRHEWTIQVLQERFADSGEIGFLLWTRGDVAVAQPGAFAIATGVRP